MNDNKVIVSFKDNIETPLNLIIPERYTIHEQSGYMDNESRHAVTSDRRLINPQNVTILSGENEGKEAFVYYLAYECAKWIDDKRAVIPESMIFFITDPIEMMPDTYLGQEVFINGEKTESGIYITPFVEKKEGVRIKLTHVPKNSIASVGDIVITIDDKQYSLIYGGQTHIKLMEREIVAIVNGEDIIPVRDNLLVEYITDEDEAIRMAENERIYNQMDFCRKHNMHIEGMQFKPVPEPKTTEVKILKGKYSLKNGIAIRNYGVNLSNKKWIIAIETLLAIISDKNIIPIAI